MSDAPRPSLLRAERLAHAFSGGVGTSAVWAVRDLDLELFRGESLGLVGESGCGKSTLGRCLLRLLRPTRGRVFFAGDEITGLSQRALRPFRRRMQIVFQDPAASLNPRLRVRDMLREPRRAHRLPLAAGDRQLAELLAQVGLGVEALDRYPHQFSGGQRQRLCIARALSVEPELIVADEPTSALDVSIRAQVLNLLADLKREHRLTYLFISHDLRQVEYLCDRVAVMFAGRLVEVGDAADLFATPLHPYAKELLTAALGPTDRNPAATAPLPTACADTTAELPGCAYAPRCPHTLAECHAVRPQLRPVADRQVACHRV